VHESTPLACAEKHATARVLRFTACLNHDALAARNDRVTGKKGSLRAGQKARHRKKALEVTPAAIATSHCKR
jgi:hypothetical protein